MQVRCSSRPSSTFPPYSQAGFELSLLRVQTLLADAGANTLLRYAHVQPDPMADLLALLGDVRL